MSVGNAISLSRLPLLFLCVGLLYVPGAAAKLACVPLLFVLFLMDWFDGYFARLRNQVTKLGAVLDIAIDRTVENVLWVAFLAQGMVGIWVPAIFLTRSFVVDGIRGVAVKRGHTPFGMMTSPVGKFLVASRFMRALYGAVKMAAFLALAGAMGAVEAGWPSAPAALAAAQALVYASVALNLLRGIPVLFDSRDLFREEGQA
jgi:CDP-diacylglycerol--glycerol-3-phosphate 3-phosphatidyltransferase